MSVTTSTAVVGSFADRMQADRAILALQRAGFRSDQIGVATRNDSPHATFKTPDPEDEAEDQASVGALAGAAAGAGLGGLIELGVLAGFTWIPVVGPALAAGTLAAILSSAVGGAAVGGIAGALIGYGIPEEHAVHYEGEIGAGRTIVSVHADERSDEARSILRAHGATSRDDVVPTDIV